MEVYLRNDMHFSYHSYKNLLTLIHECGYAAADYHDYDKNDKSVILRHDIDLNIEKALEFAIWESECGEIRSTYFVLLTSDFYNLFSKKNREMIRRISHLGHTVGLHFDETAYPKDIGNTELTIWHIHQEISILSEIVEKQITSFSYHRPSKTILEANLQIDGLTNSYSDVFFKDFKYLSDSRMSWREPVLDIIKSKKYSRLHILTHPFWYYETEQSMQKVMLDYVKKAETERYECLYHNFTNLSEVITKTELGG